MAGRFIEIWLEDSDTLLLEDGGDLHAEEERQVATTVLESSIIGEA